MMIPAETILMAEQEAEDRIAVWKEQYDEAIAALWATETKLQAAETEVMRLHKALHIILIATEDGPEYVERVIRIRGFALDALSTPKT